MESITDMVARTYRVEDDPVRSVHWKSEETQLLRFDCLCRGFLHRPDESFSVLDAGCGLGAFRPFLARRFPLAGYVGIDVVPAFVEACRRNHPGVDFRVADMLEVGDEHDYAVVSGVFNEIPPGVSPEAFSAWVEERLAHLYALSRCGIVVNFIADIGLRFHNPRNYYAEPGRYLGLAARLSRFFTLWHDYPLYEMTLAVFRPEAIRLRRGEAGDWR